MNSRQDRALERKEKFPQLLASLFAAIVLVTAAHGADATARDVVTEIKAAYLYHFSNYIRWPATAFDGPDAPLVLGVAGPESVADEISRVLAGRAAGTRPIIVRRIAANDSLDGVHLLFVDASFERTPRLLDASGNKPVLIITEGNDGLRTGGAIHFVVEDDRVRFDIAPGVIRQHGLDVSAQLLTVARLIQEPEE